MRIFTFWLFLGGHFDEKIKKNIILESSIFLVTI